MKIRVFAFLLSILFMSTITTYATVNITKVINNTDQTLYLKYNVPIQTEIVEKATHLNLIRKTKSLYH